MEKRSSEIEKGMFRMVRVLLLEHIGYSNREARLMRIAELEVWLTEVRHRIEQGR